MDWHQLAGHFHLKGKVYKKINNRFGFSALNNKGFLIKQNPNSRFLILPSLLNSFSILNVYKKFVEVKYFHLIQKFKAINR